MNKLYFAVMLAISLMALLCGALFSIGLGSCIWFVNFFVFALLCTFLYFYASSGGSRGDADDARKYGWLALVLWVAAVVSAGALL